MIVFYIFLLFFSPFFQELKAAGVLDVLNQEMKDSHFTLDKHLKKNIGSLLPASSKEKYKELHESLEKKDYSQALKLWSPSFQKTAFAKSSTGEALYAFLMFKNGLRAFGLKRLLNKVNPQKVDSIVYDLWKTNISLDQKIWNHFMNPWSKEWTKFFNEDISLKVVSRNEFSIIRDRGAIEYFLALPSKDSNVDRSHLEWSLALHFINKGDMDSSAKILTWLLKQTKDKNKRNTIYLTIARLLNDIGEYKASLYYYDKVKGVSFQWLLAQEEKSWIHYKKGAYAKSFSQSSLFTYPPLQKVLTPSMSLILSLSQLKNCDYPNLASSLAYFKSHFSERKIYLKKLLKKADFESVKKDLLDSYASSDKFLSFQSLPYQLKDDHSIKNLILFKDFLLNDERPLTENFKSFKPRYNRFVKSLDKKIDKKLAVFFQKEKSQMDEVLKQMNLIEIEALYRIHGYHRDRKNFLTLPEKKESHSHSKERAYHVVFPFESREIWGDELDDYRAFLSKLCPVKSYIL